MSYEENVQVVTALAAADYSGEGVSTDGRNRFVTLTADDTVTLSTLNAAAYGVLTTNPKQGKAGRVVISGTVPVLLGADAAAGVAIGTIADGKGSPAGTIKLGVVVKGGANGDIVPVKLIQPVLAGS